MPRFKRAFSVIEMIFVIVIIGILSSLAIPRLMLTRDDAYIAKNIEYIISVMTEISSYTVSQNGTTEDLTEMSPMLKSLQDQGLVAIDQAERSATIKIGKDSDCFTILIDSNETTELLKTSFSSSEDRICHQVQESMRENRYTIVLRGRLIKY
jgi:general secretion pathway protein G